MFCTAKLIIVFASFWAKCQAFLLLGGRARPFVVSTSLRPSRAKDPCRLAGYVNDNEEWQDFYDDDDDDSSSNNNNMEETTLPTTDKNRDKMSDTESDWMQAELTLRQVPTEPHPDLTPETVALACCRSLQWVDYPTPTAGLERCFDFFTFECRKAVTARQGGNTVLRFQQYGLLSPALQPFMGAHRIDLGPGTLTATQPPLRGAIMSFPVTIQVAKVLAVQHPSGMERAGIVADPPPVYMVMRLEQQRRPPNQGCWLVREVLDVRHAFAGDLGNAHVGG